MIRKISLSILLLWLGAVMALAGPLDQGNSLYQAGQYEQAIAAYQQAATQTQGVEQAKAYYKIGLAYHKLGQNAQALQAYQQADRIDPGHSFATPGSFEKNVGYAQRGSNRRPSGPAQSSGEPLHADRDPAYQQLAAGNVYVDPQYRGMSPQALEQAAQQGRENPHTRVKIALLETLPPGYRSRTEYAVKLHRALNLTKNGLVVVVDSGPGAGVSVVTDGLSAQDSTRLAREYAPKISADPTQGTAALAQAVASEINAKEYRGMTIVWLFFFLVVTAVAVLLVSASRRKKQELAAMRGPIDALRGNVLSGIEYLDGYADVLPKNNPDSDQVRAFRQAASAKYDQAAKILDRATETTDLQRAQGLLDRAQADVQQARRYLDRATGGTGNIPGDEAVRPEPLPTSEAEVQQIPADQRGVSFFSGQPAPLSALVPVTLTVSGQSRQVLVTPEEADELRQGRMPQVRAFNVGGRYVPWYEYNDYDPYRDYWRYQNAGWGGFGGGVVAGLVGAELLDSLFAPRYVGGGYSPYAFATDTDYYRGYYDAQQADRAAGYSFGNADSQAPYDNAGGADFLGSAGPGYDNQGYDTQSYDTQSYDNAGGADFLGGGDYGGDQS